MSEQGSTGDKNFVFEPGFLEGIFPTQEAEQPRIDSAAKYIGTEVDLAAETIESVPTKPGDTFHSDTVTWVMD